MENKPIRRSASLSPMIAGHDVRVIARSTLKWQPVSLHVVRKTG
jgi:hypothetical protein